MTPSNGIVEIRTLAELLSLYEIASDSTLAKDQYRNPLRPYRLIQPEASCQREALFSNASARLRRRAARRLEGADRELLRPEPPGPG